MKLERYQLCVECDEVTELGTLLCPKCLCSKFLLLADLVNAPKKLLGACFSGLTKLRVVR